MSQLANSLKNLRGTQSQQAVADATGLNSRTLQRAESGEGSVSLDTLRDLAAHYKLTRPEYAALLVAWLQLELGTDFDSLDIKPRGKAVALTDDEQFLASYKQVPAKLQRELRRAVQREEVLKSLAPLNDLYDRLTSQV
jgi:transcriptional regulator with XRE-family HTH domain